MFYKNRSRSHEFARKLFENEKGPLAPFLLLTQTSCAHVLRPACLQPALGRKSATRHSLFGGFGDEDFHPAVGRTSGGGTVIGHRLARTVAFDADAVHGDAMLYQVVAGGVGAVERQRVVDGIATGVVGMADDAHRGDRVLLQGGGKAVQHRSQVGLDGIAAAVERYIAGDVELQLVIAGLADADAGTLRCLFHRFFLFLHVLRPQIAAARADGRAHYRAGGGTAAGMAAGSSRADQCAETGTDRRTGAGGFLGLVHVGATGQAAECEGKQQHAGNGLFHDGIDSSETGCDVKRRVAGLNSGPAGDNTR